MGPFSTFVSKLHAPYALAFHNGSLYVSNTKGNTISKITSEGVVSIYFDHDLSAPTGLVFDDHGNLYVANSNTTSSNGFIIKISLDKTVTRVISTGLTYPAGLAMDKQGNLFIATNGDTDNDGTIVKLSTDGEISTFVSNLNYPNCLAFDNLGNLYISCDSDEIYKVNPEGYMYVFLSSKSHLQYPNGLVFCNDDLYVSNYGNIGDKTGTIIKISQTQGCTCVTKYAENLDTPTYLAMDEQGYLYVGCNSNNDIQKSKNSVFLKIIQTWTKYRWGRILTRVLTDLRVKCNTKI